MLISMAIGFYTSRVVLSALGVEDFGLFNIIGGVVVLMSSMNSSLSSASSRFLAYNMSDADKLRRTFDNAFLIHAAVSAIVLILGETIGLWFVNTQLVIDSDRMFAANCVYQATLVSAVLGITQIPYNACIIAHEQMNVYAVVEIFSSVLKLSVAFIVLYLPFRDTLIQYSVLYALVSIAIMMTYRIYCNSNFDECNLRFRADWGMMKQLLGFIGWNMFSEVCLTFRQQGLNVILNRTFGTIINAASGVALQVQAILYGFIGNITTAFKPQIIKSYADGEFSRCNGLILTGAKCTSLLNLLISVPVLINLDFLMDIWLVDVPEYAVVLGRICLIQNIVNSLNAMPFTSIMTIDMLKMFSILVGFLHLMCVIVAYILLRLTGFYYIVYSVSVLFTMFGCVLNLTIAKRQFRELDVKSYFFRIILPIFFILIASCAVTAFVYNSLSGSFSRLLLTTIVSTITVSVFASMFVLTRDERKFILQKIGL